MKFIKKYNESSDSKVDIEYIKDCFIDVLENNYFESEIKRDDYEERRVCFRRIKVDIKIITPDPKGQNSIIGRVDVTLDQLKKRVDKMNELVLDIETAIKRVLDYFPEVKPKILTNKLGFIFIELYW